MKNLTESEDRELCKLQYSVDYQKIEELAKKAGRLLPVKNNNYVLLSPALFKEGSGERRWAELWERCGGTGFFHSNQDSSKVYAFILEKNVPEDFREFVAQHELSEPWYIPPAGVDDTSIGEHAHAFAAEQELIEVFEKGKEFAIRYVSWLPEDYFEQIEPGASRNIKPGSGLEMLAEVVELLCSIGLYRQSMWLRDFPWLREAKKYASGQIK